MQHMHFSFGSVKSAVVSFVSKTVAALGWVKLTIGAAVIVVGAVVLSQVAFQGEAAPQESHTPQVTVARVSELISDRGSFPTLGHVRSQTEATVQTESQGQIVRVTYDLGDFVTAGAIIAELENASERASVRQAEAALAQLERGVIRQEGDARASALNTYRNAFTVADDAVKNKADQFFSAPLTSAPRINIGYFEISDINSRRGAINDILSAWQNNLDTISTSDDLEAALAKAETDLAFIKRFLDDLSSLVNRQKVSNSLSQTTLDAQKAAVSSARTSVDAAFTNITSAQNELASADTTGIGTERQNEIAAAEALLSAARATLEQTIVRAPISGTINSLDLERGDFVSAFTPVVTIANNNALLVEAFVTATDKRNIAVGNEAIIDDRYSGIITNIAPGLDPTTNRVKVEIGVQDEGVDLTHGSTVRLEIERNEVEQSGDTPQEIIIPITALKVGTDSIVVFTVSDENTLVAHAITEGPLVGSNIVIEEGVTPDMEIVLDARGLNEGDRVQIAER